MFCQNGDIRLINGSNMREGRIEICVNETWGTVCDTTWTATDAGIACRQLGYQSINATPIYNARFGPGSGRILLDNILCNGNEERLVDCPNSGLGMVTGCSGHGDDAGLMCSAGM